MMEVPHLNYKEVKLFIKDLINLKIVCDAQCGSSNCLTTGSDKGFCSGCLQDSETFSFFGYKQASPGQKKFEVCITDCEHFGRRYGDISADGTGFCNGNKNLFTPFLPHLRLC